MSYDGDHNVAVLTAILDYVNERLVLQLLSNPTGSNTNMPYAKKFLFWQTNQLVFPCTFVAGTSLPSPV